ncbi:MAG: YebC/PmpR family DNA-binding transcriptional regulator [Pirellulaceae bacterium]|jgi:YebC/PmpR family DNA-binding regulatory protein|nr:YebC/PmpR family DNA-binding transcriptional regulator [Pirellulaceae bacterium]
MAGHSHWAGIKHKKSLIDSKRGKLWSKLSKAIIVAAKMGGGDIETNIRLRTAIADAKAVSMPKDNIARAVKKGTGELAGGEVDEILYEGYGPGGVAVMCDIMTDNRNRTAPEIRKLFEVNSGKLGSSNCVAWMFERKGLFVINASNIDEETLMELAMESGADDLRHENESFEVTCEVEAYSQLSEALEQAEIPVETKQVTRIPTNVVEVTGNDARKVLKLLDALDEHDDVQNVSANLNIPDDMMAELTESE